METKLTLRLEKKIIEQIKVYALKHDVTLSTLTSNLYKEILINHEDTTDDINTPIAKKYMGILRGKEFNANDLRLNRLKEKHLR